MNVIRCITSKNSDSDSVAIKAGLCKRVLYLYLVTHIPKDYYIKIQ